MQKLKTELKISNTALTLLLCVKVLFWPKTLIFGKKNADISKIKRVLEIKAIFSETTYVSVLTCQVSSIIPTSFRQVGNFTTPPSPAHKKKELLKKPIQIRVHDGNLNDKELFELFAALGKLLNRSVSEYLKAMAAQYKGIGKEFNSEGLLIQHPQPLVLE